MEAMKRRTRGGIVEWKCVRCELYFPRKYFIREGQRQEVCNLCIDVDEREAILRTLPIFKHAWGPMPRSQKDIDAVVWRAVKSYTPGIRKGFNPEGKRGPVSFKEKKEAVLREIVCRRMDIPNTYQEPLASLVASVSFPPKAAVWLAFRRGVLSLHALRMFAVQCAESAAEAAGLFREFDRLSALFVKLWNIVAKQSGSLYETRIAVYAMQSRIEKIPHTKEMTAAGAALTAMCFPNSWTAAITASSRYFEILLASETEKDSWELLGLALRESLSKKVQLELEKENGRRP